MTNKEIASVQRLVQLEQRIVTMKMAATNAMAALWLPKPPPDDHEAVASLVDALAAIQSCGIEAMREIDEWKKSL